MAITFEVSDVTRDRTPMPLHEAKSNGCLQGWRVEAMGTTVPRFLAADHHGLLSAVHTAYASHYPLVLTPDAVWLAIAQGFAQHVNQNAERLRDKFVRHPGKAKITIRRDDFVEG